MVTVFRGDLDLSVRGTFGTAGAGEGATILTGRPVTGAPTEAADAGAMSSPWAVSHHFPLFSLSPLCLPFLPPFTFAFSFVFAAFTFWIFTSAWGEDDPGRVFDRE